MTHTYTRSNAWADIWILLIFSTPSCSFNNRVRKSGRSLGSFWRLELEKEKKKRVSLFFSFLFSFSVLKHVFRFNLRLILIYLLFNQSQRVFSKFFCVLGDGFKNFGEGEQVEFCEKRKTIEDIKPLSFLNRVKSQLKKVMHLTFNNNQTVSVVIYR